MTLAEIIKAVCIAVSGWGGAADDPQSNGAYVAQPTAQLGSWSKSSGEALSNYNQGPGGYSTAQASADPKVANPSAVLEERVFEPFETAQPPGYELQNDISPDGKTLSVYFPLDKFSLGLNDTTDIESFASNIPTGYSIRLEGFADHRGSEGYNNTLAQRRLDSAWLELIQHTDPSVRIEPEINYGEFASSGKTWDEMRRDRRVEFTIYKSDEPVVPGDPSIYNPKMQKNDPNVIVQPGLQGDPTMYDLPNANKNPQIRIQPGLQGDPTIYRPNEKKLPRGIETPIQLGPFFV